MSGRQQTANPAVERPLDGRVGRHGSDYRMAPRTRPRRSHPIAAASTKHTNFTVASTPLRNPRVKNRYLSLAMVLPMRTESLSSIRGSEQEHISRHFAQYHRG